jgi:sigma-B regulation protein RsbU (phosphoserine phosphatase)
MGQLDVVPSVAVTGIRDVALYNQLRTRRDRLQAALPAVPSPDRLAGLLREVDAALARMQEGTFGLCETCHDPIESDRLLADPLTRNCLDHLSPAERRALEHDLDLASQVQRGLLPRPGSGVDGWATAYHYEPAGAVSGDYCDLISRGNGEAFFFVGDVTGKGVAASMLMAQLFAIFRSLAAGAQAPAELLAKANRVFCEGIVSSHFATLAGGWLGAAGAVQLCNAGHCPPLHVSHDSVAALPSTGLPLGLFAEADYETQTLTLAPGDSLVLYTDGLTEAFNHSGEQYGTRRLSAVVKQLGGSAPQELLAGLVEDVTRFRAGPGRGDDLTIMILRREV